jgi:hypothetical protein
MRFQSNSLYNKLAFTGYRIFLEGPPRMKEHTRCLHYFDVDQQQFELMAETSGGHYPSPEEYATHFAKGKSRLDGQSYKPAFVNNDRYQRLWTADWYEND